VPVDPGPAAPVEAPPCGAPATRAGGGGVTIVGTLAYVADSQFGLSIIDVTGCGPCPADFNGDGAVNILDFTAFQAAFSAMGTFNIPARSNRSRAHRYAAGA